VKGFFKKTVERVTMPQWRLYKSARTIPHTAKSSLKINVEVGLQQHCGKTHACGKKTERKLSGGIIKSLLRG
jgi:hypothetical protein